MLIVLDNSRNVSPSAQLLPGAAGLDWSLVTHP